MRLVGCSRLPEHNIKIPATGSPTLGRTGSGSGSDAFLHGRVMLYVENVTTLTTVRAKWRLYANYVVLTAAFYTAAMIYFQLLHASSSISVHMRLKVFNVGASDDAMVMPAKDYNGVDTRPLGEEVSLSSFNTSSVTSSDVTKVLVAAYYRSGSTFVSDLLQLANNTFFLFEPFYAIYAHWYGTVGYHEVLFTGEGTPRVLPPGEDEKLVSMTANMLNCEFDSLPPEFFVNVFHFRYPSSPNSNYVNCLTSVGVLENSHQTCFSSLTYTCNSRAFLNTDTANFCHRTKNSPPGSSPAAPGYNPGFAAAAAEVGVSVNGPYVNIGSGRFMRSSDTITGWKMKSYTSCVQNLYQKAQQCIPLLRQECLDSKVRVIKSIRMSVDVISRVTATVPDLKVVHLVRDPRAMLHSRRTWVSPTNREVMATCARMVSDVNAGDRLQAAHPSTYTRLRYEDVVTSPERTALDLFNHVGISSSRAYFTQWLQNHTSAQADNSPGGTIRANSAAHVDLWRANPLVSSMVTTYASQDCVNVIRQLGYVI